MEINWLQIALWVIAIAAVAYGVYVKVTTGAPVGDTTALIRDAMQVAQDAVAAAEQLWRSRQIERDERFDWVHTKLQRLYPDLSADALEMTIEAAVYWLKQGVIKAQENSHEENN